MHHYIIFLIYSALISLHLSTFHHLKSLDLLLHVHCPSLSQSRSVPRGQEGNRNLLLFCSPLGLQGPKLRRVHSWYSIQTRSTQSGMRNVGGKSRGAHRDHSVQRHPEGIRHSRLGWRQRSLCHEV